MSLVAVSALALLSPVVLVGCAPAGPSPKEQLTAGYREFDQKLYDQAFATAEAFLKKTPAGPGSAEALYLQGRVYEARAEQAGTANYTDEVRANLTSAANSYLRAVQQAQARATPPVEGLAHAGLANAAFHLDDFDTAVREWGLAFPLLADADAKAWTLLRIGICQQRLGWFEMADRTLTRVTHDFPNQEPAQRAASRIGRHAFYLQVGTFTSSANADRELASLRKKQVPATRGTDAVSGRHTVRAGPFSTWAEARTMQVRLAPAFPGAVVVP